MRVCRPYQRFVDLPRLHACSLFPCLEGTLSMVQKTFLSSCWCFILTVILCSQVHREFWLPAGNTLWVCHLLFSSSLVSLFSVNTVVFIKGIMNFKPWREGYTSVVILCCYTFNISYVECYKNIRDNDVLQESRIYGLRYYSCSKKWILMPTVSQSREGNITFLLIFSEAACSSKLQTALFLSLLFYSFPDKI